MTTPQIFATLAELAKQAGAQLENVAGVPLELEINGDGYFVATLDCENDGDRHHVTHLVCEFLTSAGAQISETDDDALAGTAFIYFNA